MGCVFPVNYCCRVDQDDKQGVSRTLIGRAEALAIAQILSSTKRFPENLTRLADALLLNCKAVSEMLMFDRQAGRRKELDQFTLSARLW